MGADNVLSILNSAEPLATVEEWVERAGIVLYLAAVGEVPTRLPAEMQKHVNMLVAQMPESLLIVSTLGAKEALELVDGDKDA
jgi:hypothetical protein